MREAFISVQSQFQALHAWPAAPEQVDFLQHPHRHIFKVKVSVRVLHSDRQAEFFMTKAALDMSLQRYQDSFNPANLLNIGSLSCEMIAEQVLGDLHDRQIKVFMVEVSEDGENSATVVETEV